MPASHGKLTQITVATKDISPYCKTSSYEMNGAAHDTTGYGSNSVRRDPGLKDGKFSCGGTYDTTALLGPRNALHALVATKVAVIRKPEGTGTGKPQDSFTAVLTKYVETNPVDDYVSWSAEFEIDGDVTTTSQA